MSDQPPSVAALIAKWRTEDGVCHCDIHCECDASGYRACADELEALLGRLPVPQQPQIRGCLCLPAEMSICNKPFTNCPLVPVVPPQEPEK
jgi:hypothetical protein